MSSNARCALPSLRAPNRSLCRYNYHRLLRRTNASVIAMPLTLVGTNH
jgi:hypothetical protein